MGKADSGTSREGGGVFLLGLACDRKLLVGVKPEGSSPGKGRVCGDRRAGLSPGRGALGKLNLRAELLPPHL